MKKIVLVIVLLTIACESKSNIEILISDKIIEKSLGLIKVEKLNKPEKINDSTFSASHVFKNEMVDKKMRITNTYYFNKQLNFIKKSETTKTETESNGKFIKLNI